MTKIAKEDRGLLAYAVGGLLYMPALNRRSASKLVSGGVASVTSAAFCLEDSVEDDALEAAEKELGHTLRMFADRGVSDAPLLFVRVRTPEHLLRVHGKLGDGVKLLTGYILPKFDMSNAGRYMSAMKQVNADGRFYAMPILESLAVADRMRGPKEMYDIKDVLDAHKDYILNVRVGGNDFSNLYGVRRHVNETIYGIGPIRDLLSCILGVFAGDYVVSGPVWEYFGSRAGGAWEKGLRAELEADRLNGFVGKTAIHPCQLPAIVDSLKVSQEDYWDALKVLSWDNGGLAVEKSAGVDSRMNEVKCHVKWAEKTATLGRLYGIRGQEALPNAI